MLFGSRLNKLSAAIKSIFESIYSVASKEPELVFDFAEDYYRTSGSDATFADSITHARSGNATMVDTDGLLKWAPHNLLLRSEEFDNAAWNPIGVTVAPDVTATTAPDNSNTADKLAENTSATSHNVFQTITSSSTAAITCSVYLKAAERTWARISFDFDTGGYRRFWVDLSTGNLGTVDGATATLIDGPTITPVGNGWYRCSITASSTAGTTRGLFVATALGDLSTTFSGVTGSGIYIWGAHLYRSDLGGMVDNPDRGDSYVPTTTSARYLPRRGHHVYNGDSWVDKGVLVESEARTNLWPWSTSINNAAWTKTSTTVSTGAADPSGGTSAETIVEHSGSIAAAGFFDRDGQSAATSYTISALVKAAGRNIVYSRGSYVTSTDWLAAYFDLSAETATLQEGMSNTGTNVSCGIESVGGGWYFIWHSFTTSASITTDYTWFGISNGASINPVNGIVSYTGDGVSGVSFWLPQIEAGLTPSSRIPTSGSTVTRAADSLTVPSANLPYSSEAMSIQMDGEMTYADEFLTEQAEFVVWQKDVDNRIALRLNTASGAGGGSVRFLQEATNVLDFLDSSPDTYSPGTNVPFNIASRHGSTFINGAVDGTALTADTTPTALPDLSATDLQLAFDYMGTIKTFRIWADDLGDEGIEEASAPSIVPSLSLTFDGASTSFTDTGMTV